MWSSVYSLKAWDPNQEGNHTVLSWLAEGLDPYTDDVSIWIPLCWKLQAVQKNRTEVEKDQTACPLLPIITILK